jgi:hypothetical protein
MSGADKQLLKTFIVGALAAIAGGVALFYITRRFLMPAEAARKVRLTATDAKANAAKDGKHNSNENGFYQKKISCGSFWACSFWAVAALRSIILFSKRKLTPL